MKAIVKDSGCNYTTHETAFKKAVLKYGVSRSDWAYGESLCDGSIVNIIGEVMEQEGNNLVLVRKLLNNDLHIIGSKGLTKIIDKTHNDQVNHPKHYQFFDTEAIEIIRQSLTDEEWLGYCKGNALKYRLRAGGKDEVNQEIGKARKYQELYEKYKDGVN